MKHLTTSLLLAVGATAATAAGAAAPSPEEMWAIIQKQQAQIEQLQQQLAAAGSRLEQTDHKVEATASLLEERLEAPASLDASGVGRTTLGGYAEMTYNNWDNQRSAGEDKHEIDFQRFVLNINHQFSEKTRMYSEVELEHALVEGEEDKGELELEQAYIEHDLGGTQQAKAGLFLVPVGILNETHEPDTFYGVERNNVETRIIPTTWWEGGLALGGELAPGLRYDAAFTSGMLLEADEDQWMIRDGRQEVSKADASDPAYTARLKYTGIAGLELATTLQYQQDIYQGELQQRVDAILYEAHLAYQHGPFGLRALAASWDIDDAIDQFEAGADTQEGWYVEPSWRPLEELGFFARYSEWDNAAGGGGDSQYSEWDIGLNYWLEEHVVFKVDYQFQDAPSGEDEYDGFNLGVGWSF